MTSPPQNDKGRRVVLTANTLVPVGVLLALFGAAAWLTNVAANVRKNTEADKEIVQRYFSLEAQIESVRTEMRTALSSLGSKSEVDLMIRAAVSESVSPIHRQLGEIMGRLKAIEDQQAKARDE